MNWPRSTNPSCSSAPSAKSTSDDGTPSAAVIASAVVGPTTSSRPRTSSRTASSRVHVLARSRSGATTAGSQRTLGNTASSIGSRSAATHSRGSRTSIPARPALARSSNQPCQSAFRNPQSAMGIAPITSSASCSSSADVASGQASSRTRSIAA